MPRDAFKARRHTRVRVQELTVRVTDNNSGQPVSRVVSGALNLINFSLESVVEHIPDDVPGLFERRVGYRHSPRAWRIAKGYLGYVVASRERLWKVRCAGYPAQEFIEIQVEDVVGKFMWGWQEQAERPSPVRRAYPKTDTAANIPLVKPTHDFADEIIDGALTRELFVRHRRDLTGKPKPRRARKMQVDVCRATKLGLVFEGPGARKAAEDK